MADIFQDPKTGELFIRAPGGQMVPAPSGGIAQESGLGAVGAQALNVASQAVAGAQALEGKALNWATGTPDTLQTNPALQSYRDLQAQADARGAASPSAAPFGTLLGYAPDAAVAAMTGGGSLGERMALQAGGQAMLGAARTPDAPIMGAALQGGLGAAGPVLDAGAGLVGRAVKPAFVRGADMAAGIIDRVSPGASDALRTRLGMGAAGDAGARGSIGAMRNSGAAIEGAGRQFPHLLSAQEADTAGLVLSPAQRLMLDLRQGDTAGMQQVERARTLEDLARGAPLTSPAGLYGLGKQFPDLDAAAAVNQTHLTQRVAAEMGDPNAFSLNQFDREKIKTQVSADFEQLAQNMPEKVAIPTMAGDFTREIHGADYRVRQDLNKYIERLQETKGVMSRRDYLGLRTELSDLGMSASRTGNESLAQSVGVLMETMDARTQQIFEAAGDKGSMDALQQARDRWHILKMLEKPNVVNVEGEVNPKSFMNEYARSTPSFNKTTRVPTDFERYLQTQVMLNAKLKPQTGAWPRLIAGVARAPGTTAATGIAAYMGFKN